MIIVRMNSSDTFDINFVPRIYVNDVRVRIRREMKNDFTEFDATTTWDNLGVMTITTDYNFVDDCRYVIFIESGDNIVYRGKIWSTTKTREQIQNNK